MGQGFHESWDEKAIEPPSERSTGLVFAVVSLVAAIVFRDSGPEILPKILPDLGAGFVAGIAASTAFIALALAAPGLLRPLNLAWFRLSLLLNRIVSPIVMAAMFLIAIVPLGLIMRLWRDPLRLDRRPDLASYWQQRERTGEEGSMRNQF